MADREIVAAKLSDLESAFARFQEVMAMPESDLQRDAAIKRVEFTFELCWKTLKAVLDFEGVGFLKSPREVLRNAHVVGYIEDAIVWEAMLEARNLTVHTYQEELTRLVHSDFGNFLSAISVLISKLRRTYPTV